MKCNKAKDFYTPQEFLIRFVSSQIEFVDFYSDLIIDIFERKY